MSSGNSRGGRGGRGGLAPPGDEGRNRREFPGRQGVCLEKELHPCLLLGGGGLGWGRGAASGTWGQIRAGSCFRRVVAHYPGRPSRATGRGALVSLAKAKA